MMITERKVWRLPAEELLAELNGIVKVYKGVNIEGTPGIPREDAIARIKALPALPPFSESDATRWLGPAPKVKA